MKKGEVEILEKEIEVIQNEKEMKMKVLGEKEYKEDIRMK